MRVLMMAVLLVTALPAAAQKWVHQGENDVVSIYFDPGTVRVNGHVRRVWELQDLKQRGSSGEMSHRVLREYDCKEERYRTLSYSMHSEPMAEGRTLSSSSEPGNWNYIPPRTGDEFRLRYFCATL